ncbi:TetR family transcriptional regulator [Streptomyces sp. AK04-3B]|uniref:TetR family transcriptional regulator n=1 Tax=Streptomyces sp. AK04-3B TaxID=3028650 RepID=UPI0029A7E366|nr:TetR family transcriptional regulator [Streptomyces sp. AK04-3B]MDX3803183.1 TetR family transcriptional regulator [Streptomyces sp. AK04-3B]
MISSTPSAGSASLTERRKAATRMEIARAAAGLFVSRGLKATRAEDIAQAAGIAPRTFYRYFATKEEAVAPLYSAGAERWAQALREAPAELPVPQALEHAVRHTLVTGRGVSAASWEWVRTLIRLAGASPALGKVWAEVCHASETTIAEVLAERAAATEARTSSPQASPSTAAATSEAPDAPGDSVGIHAANGTQAVGGTAAGADGDPPEGSDLSGAGALASEAPGPSEAPDATEAPLASPRQRFTAAVASAAVRVAVESWAVTDAAPTGPQGPAELALHNLRDLHGFAWEARPAQRT